MMQAMALAMTTRYFFRNRVEILTGMFIRVILEKRAIIGIFVLIGIIGMTAGVIKAFCGHLFQVVQAGPGENGGSVPSLSA